MHYATKVGASGDDYTGLLTSPRGLLLLGLGVVTLWTTRRPRQPPMALPAPPPARCRQRRDRAVRRRTARRGKPLHPLGHTVVPAANIGAEYEQVSFTTSDGLELAGW